MNNGKSILVVSPDADKCESLAGVLRKAGYNVDIVQGTEVETAVSTTTYSAVVHPTTHVGARPTCARHPQATLSSLAAIIQVEGESITCPNTQAANELQAVLSSITDAVIITDFDGKITAANAVANELFGCELTGTDSAQPISLLFPCSADGIPFSEGGLPSLRQVSKTQVTDLEITCHSSSGKEMCVLVSSTPIRDVEGKIAGAVHLLHDISESRHVHQAFQESQQSYQLLFELLSDAVLLVKRPAGIILEANSAALDLYGYSRSEMLKLKYEELSSELQQADARRSPQRLIPIRYQRKKDGTIFPVEVSAQHIELQGCDCMIVVVRDITQRILQEKILCESEERFRLLVENSGDCITLHDSNGAFIYASPAVKPVAGYEPEELVGRHPKEFIHPKDLDAAMNYLSSALLCSHSSPHEFRFLHKNGSYIFLEATTSVISDDIGKPNSIFVTNRDITERKQLEQAHRESEERFEQIAEQMTEMIWEVDSEGLYTYVSKVSEALTGYCPDEIIGKKHFYDLHPAECRETFKQAAFAAFESRERLRNLQNCIETRDGRTVWVSTNGLPHIDEQGNLIGYRGSDTDVTEQKKYGEALQESEQRYRQLFECMQSGFAMHEIICDDSGTPVDYRYLEINPAFEKLTGIKAQSSIGRTIKEIIPNIERHWIDRYGKVALTGQPARFEEYVAGLDKYYSVFAFCPQIGQFAVTFMDVTEHHKAKQVMEQAFQRERRIADSLQHSLIQDMHIHATGCEISGRHQSALEEAGIGGDFYDVFTLMDGRLVLSMGDVTGKGLEAAANTAMTKYSLRAYAYERPEPAYVLQRLNEVMCEQIPEDMFVTVFCSVYNPANGTLTYCGAGHEYPLLYRSKHQDVVSLKSQGRVIGVFRDASYVDSTVVLDAEDVLLVFTDGITDARSLGKFFETEDLAQVLKSCAQKGCDQIAEEIIIAASTIAQGCLPDDVAVLVMKVKSD